MRKYLAYIKYILKHKYYVFIGGRKVGASLWRLLTHDLSKFLPDEFLPYADHFYAEDGTERPLSKEPLGYKMAWWLHIRRNDHHWQHWMLFQDDLKVYHFTMPNAVVREMVADWYGASLMAVDKNKVRTWYGNNEFKELLNIDTKKRIEELLELLGDD